MNPILRENAGALSEEVDLDRVLAALGEIRVISDQAERFVDVPCLDDAVPVQLSRGVTGRPITVKRTPSADGTAIDEQYAVYDRLMIGAHEL